MNEIDKQRLIKLLQKKSYWECARDKCYLWLLSHWFPLSFWYILIIFKPFSRESIWLIMQIVLLIIVTIILIWTIFNSHFQLERIKRCTAKIHQINQAIIAELSKGID